MIAVLRYEWVRISTVRSTKIMLGLAVLFSLGLGYLIASPQSSGFDETGQPVGPETIDWFGAFGFPLTLTAVLASVVAAQAIGQEYRFGLIRLTLTAFPRRLHVLVAKLVVVISACIVLALAAYLGSWLAVTLRGDPTPPEGVSAPDATFLLRGVVFVVLWGLSAFAIAGVTRQTAVGIAVPIVSGLIVENLMIAFLSDKAKWLVDVLPWSTANRWFMAVEDQAVGVDGAPAMAPVGWAALGVFGAWVLAFLVVEFVAFLRRDA